jgi:hypothetical protein
MDDTHNDKFNHLSSTSTTSSSSQPTVSWNVPIQNSNDNDNDNNNNNDDTSHGDRIVVIPSPPIHTLKMPVACSEQILREIAHP